MKSTIAIITLVVSFSVFSKTILWPPEAGEGFININGKAEFKYDIYPGKIFWSEFGRTYWRSSKKIANRIISTKKLNESDSVKMGQSGLNKIDTDYDGVSDEIDRCPETPASKKVNAWGCDLARKDQSIRVEVSFDLNKAKLKKERFKDLDKLGLMLLHNPEVKVEIEGHTDTKGERSYNMILSQKRAAAVVDYLLEKHGIEGRRLRAKGYGPDRPVASNQTLVGRKRNRRVTARIID